MKLRGFLPGMGNPDKNAGYRRRRSAAAIKAPGSWILTLPSGKNDLCRKGSLPSKFARAHTCRPGRVFQTHDGKVYKWEPSGNAIRIGTR